MGRSGPRLRAVIFDWGGTLTPWHTFDLAEQWTAYLKNFAAKFIQAPYAEPSFKVHTLGVPAEAQAVTTPAPEVIEPKAE